MRPLTRICLSLVLVLSHPLLAATIVVDETTCTLVDAITAANTDSAVGGCPAGSGADIIELTADVVLTEKNNETEMCTTLPGWTAEHGLPVIETDITIEGGGHVIERADGSPGFRLFCVTDKLTANSVTITKGHNPGIFVDSGTLILTNSTVSYNTRGGIIVDHGSATVTNSTVSHNDCEYGGALTVWSGTLTITDSTVSDNFAYYGAGVTAAGSTLTVTNSTLSGNTAYWNGVDGEVPLGKGGAIWVSGVWSLTNSTLSGNEANHRGSAVHSVTSYGILTNVTVSGNTGGIGPAILNYGTNISMANIIVADNEDKNCSGLGMFIDDGNNFSDEDSCGAGFAHITPGVDFDTALADNGGPTLTHALLPGSVAIDAAGDCGLETDQRGFPRNDGACDSGSYEASAPKVPMSTQLGLLLLGAGLLAVLALAVALRRRQVACSAGSARLRLLPPFSTI